MSEWFDVTRIVGPATPVWPGDPAVAMGWAARRERGDMANVSRWRLGAHTGTHVDAPLHFIDGGSTVEVMEMRRLAGPVHVLDLGHVEHLVTAADLRDQLPSDARRLLLKTRNSGSDPSRFHEDFVAVAPEAADLIIAGGILTLGIDGPSIETYNTPDFAVHHRILGAGIAVIEGLDLSGVEGGTYEMVCAPLKLLGAEGAPARVFLRPARSTSS